MQSIAIIGTGISGMGVAYFLRGQYDITFYEKNDYAGGHTNTLMINEDGQTVYVDSAFMVYNETTYPLLTRLFKELNIQTKPTSMSFSVQHVPSKLEFSGTGLNGLFAQRKNLFNTQYIRMLLEINRFNKEAIEVLENEQYIENTLAEYVQAKGYSNDFVEKFLIPLSSAVWSTPIDAMLNFPAATLVRFLKNHCFLGLNGHLQWRTCVGGSRQYRDKILGKINARLWTDRGAIKVRRTGGKVHVLDSAGVETAYDKVILACHADEALELLEEPTELEGHLLDKFIYYNNHVTLHSDVNVMPKSRRAWSSWNYRIQQDAYGRLTSTTIYDMNALQGVSTKKDYFLSINDPNLIDPNKILWNHVYRHPLYTVASQYAQKSLAKLNRDSFVYFCGAYFRYGFHEDGLWSALNVAKVIKGEKLWE